MTTLAVASGFLLGGTPGSGLFEETLSPENIQQSIRRAFQHPDQRNDFADSPNEALARVMIARQEALATATEEDGGWFDTALGVLKDVGGLGRAMGQALMYAGRGVTHALVGITSALVRTMVKIVWFGFRSVIRLLLPFIVANPILSGAIIAGVGTYLAYRTIKNREAGLEAAGEFEFRTVETTAQDLGLSEARRTGVDYRGSASSAKMGSGPKLPEHVVALGIKTADRYGIDRADFLTYIAIESGGKNVSRGEKSAKGLLQFIPSTAKMYGIEGREMDEAANLDAGARLYLDNAKFLKAKGVAPTITNLYLAHQQGPGAVKKLIDAANAGLRIDELPDGLRRNVRNNLYGKSEYVSEYVGLTKAKLEKWSAGYAAISGGATTATPPATPTAAEATQKAVDVQVQKPPVAATASTPPQPQAQPQQAPNPIRLPNGVVVDANR